MIVRRLKTQLERARTRRAVVALLGPRQVGKTTLARELAGAMPSIYLDLESVGDRARLEDAANYLSAHRHELVVLDEIQRVPELFSVLRSAVDAGTREGHPNGQFLVLGSASLDLLRQTSESLAGRIHYLELGPLDVLEVGAEEQSSPWVRGGFPGSFLAPDTATSLEWRNDFLQTYRERDIPQLGSRIPAETLRRFWTILAHRHGTPLIQARIAAGLGVNASTVSRYLDLFVDLLLVRRLAPWAENVGKRLIRSPKIYLRDSGLLHALLNVRDEEELLGHPIIGPSWEGFVIETLIRSSPRRTEAFFYRTARGAEIDLVLDLPNRERWVFEIERGSAPSVPRGFHEACKDLEPTRRFLVYSGVERFQLPHDVEAIPLFDAADLVARVGSPTF